MMRRDKIRAVVEAEATALGRLYQKELERNDTLRLENHTLRERLTVLERKYHPRIAAVGDPSPVGPQNAEAAARLREILHVKQRTLAPNHPVFAQKKASNPGFASADSPENDSRPHMSPYFANGSPVFKHGELIGYITDSDTFVSHERPQRYPTLARLSKQSTAWKDGELVATGDDIHRLTPELTALGVTYTIVYSSIPRLTSPIPPATLSAAVQSRIPRA